MTGKSNTSAEWASLGLLSLSLFAAVLFRGGVYPAWWAWSAIGIAMACVLVARRARADPAPPTAGVAQRLLAALLIWMAIAVVRLPPSIVAVVSPERWTAVLAARNFTGGDPRAWAALSVAPSATFERLLDVVPAMTAFFAIRRLSAGWRRSKWLLVAPVILVAWFESLLGALQFRTLHVGGNPGSPVTGTYVNRDHFAALLAMAFPLALLWALALWRHSKTQNARPAQSPLATIGLFAVATCLLLGVTFSASRMGFASALAAGALAIGILIAPRTRRLAAPRLAWRWAAVIVLPACLFAALPTRQLLDRYQELAHSGQSSPDARVEIWRDSLAMISAYKWVGCGLGAFEYGFYRFNSRLPMDTVDFAHNDYLQIVAELGLAGAALAMALAVWIVWRLLLVVLRTRGAPNWELAVGLLGALVAIGLHSFTDFNLYIPANALVVAWLCGVADSTSVRSESSFRTPA